MQQRFSYQGFSYQGLHRLEAESLPGGRVFRRMRNTRWPRNCPPPAVKMYEFGLHLASAARSLSFGSVARNRPDIRSFTKAAFSVRHAAFEHLAGHVFARCAAAAGSGT